MARHSFLSRDVYLQSSRKTPSHLMSGANGWKMNFETKFNYLWRRFVRCFNEIRGLRSRWSLTCLILTEDGGEEETSQCFQVAAWSHPRKTFNHLLRGCHQVANWIEEASAIIYRRDFWSRNLRFSPFAKNTKIDSKTKKKLHAITKFNSCCQTFPTIANKRGKKAKVNIIRLKDHFQFFTLAPPSRSRIDV